MGLPLHHVFCPGFPEPPLLLASPRADLGAAAESQSIRGSQETPKSGLSFISTPKSPDGRQLPTCRSEEAGLLELDGTHRASACPNPRPALGPGVKGRGKGGASQGQQHCLPAASQAVSPLTSEEDSTLPGVRMVQAESL